MKPEVIAAVVASNAEEAERAKEDAPKAQEGGVWSDAVIQLDTAGKAIELVVDIGSALGQGLHSAGACVAAACKAIPDFD